MRHLLGVALALASLNLAPAQQYVISTLAGGAPLPTPVSALNTPFIPTVTALALDSSNNLYLAGDGCIFEISTSNVMTRVAGNARIGFAGDGGPATSAQFNNVLGIAVDSAGDIYISDNLNNRVRKVSAATGNISTVAGNGTAGYAGDGATASSAELNGPTAIALDKSGNLYIADSGNNRIREVNASGVINTVAGNGLAKYAGDNLPAIYASLNAPDGLAFDSGSNLYIADSKNYVVRKINYAGVITTIAGNGNHQTGGLDLKPNTVATGVPLGTVGPLAMGSTGVLYIGDPDNHATWEVAGGLITAESGPSVALAVDSAGNLYADEVEELYDVNVYWENWTTVYKLSASGQSVVVGSYPTQCCIGDGGPATSARLFSPVSVAIDSAGNLYIDDSYNSVIRKVDPDGVINTFDPLGGARGFSYTNAGEVSLSVPAAVACDAAGNLFVADGAQLLEVTPTGAVSSWTASSPVSPPLQDVGPMDGVTPDMFGNLYVSTPEKVLKYSAVNKFSLVAGTGFSGDGKDGVGANTTPVNYPMGIAVDAYDDDVYFADSQSNRIRKISGGLVTTVAGNTVAGFYGDNGPAAASQLSGPMGVALDSAGNLYIADTGNNRIRKITPGGTITTIAGNGTAGYSGDGGPATAAQLNGPYAVQVDKAGNIYVADSRNNAIRVLSPNEPLALAGALLPGGTTGLAYSVALPASGGVLPYTWSVNAGTLPPGLTLSNAGTISGKPSTPGTFNFTVTVTDSVSSTAAQNYSIRIIAPLTLTLAPTYQAILGVSYTQALTATGGTQPYTWSVINGSLPPGLTLSSSGVINGTPTSLGMTYFSVQLTDSGNLSASQSVGISVVDPAPVIATSATLPTAVTGTMYSQAIPSTCGNSPCAWSVTPGALPAGLQLSTDGIISGTPTAAGAFTFTLTLTDSVAFTVSQSFQMTVIDSTTLTRAAVLPQVMTTGGSTTTITFANSSSTAISAELVQHGDDGSVAAGNPPAASLAPNATITLPVSNATGWVDVLTSGTVTISATFQQNIPVALQTQFEAEVDAPYDNTVSASTGVALVNLSAVAASITATVFDSNGVQLTVEQIALPANGHTSFPIMGVTGVAKFQNAAGGNLAGLILLTGLDGTLSTAAVTLP